MIRVTHVVFDLEGGGLESFVAQMGWYYHAHPGSVSLSIVTLSGRVGRLGERVRDSVERFVVERPTPVWSMVWPASLAATLRALSPDVVHLHSGAWYKPVLAARLAGCSAIVYTEHGREHDDPWRQRLLDRLAARGTRAIVAVSDRLSGYLVRRVGLPSSRVRSITNGVDTTRFAPDASRAPNPRVVIGSVGRLADVKGQDVLIEAVALLCRMPGVPQFECVIAGDGPTRAALEAQVAARSLSGVVRFLGWVDDPVRFYRGLDIYVLPSRSEGTSISLLEAMACGTAPVVTDVGSNAELLGPTLRDHVVPPADPPALAHALAALIQSPERRSAASTASRRRAVASYDWRQTVSAYEALYREILG